jgi:hypothetical protein
VVDYPVAAEVRGFQALREFQRAGRAEIGAHLHPWVTPPFDEPLTAANSFPGNLPRELEVAKLRNLVGAIESSFGLRPTVYKAGRYGFGVNTTEVLRELSFDIDVSFCPPFDFGADGGPDFSGLSPEPFWFGAGGQPLLEIPNTGAFVGVLKSLSAPVYRFATKAAVARLRLPGLLSRLRVLDRLMLSPEGYSLDELRRLTVALLRAGVRTFTFSLHSPSLKPGCTPYVRSSEERSEFLERCRKYFEFFFQKLEGVTRTPQELRSLLLTRPAILAA